jgi:integrase
LFALRRRCLQGETIRVQESLSLGKLGKPKTRASAAIIAIPASLADDFQQWWEDNGRPGPCEFIFPSTVDKPIDAHNLLRRTLKPTAESVGIKGLTFQSLRRTFATHFHGVGTVKDHQTQMRHSTAQITMDVYTQIVGDSLNAAMEAFDRKKKSDTKPRRVLNRIESELVRR